MCALKIVLGNCSNGEATSHLLDVMLFINVSVKWAQYEVYVVRQPAEGEGHHHHNHHLHHLWEMTDKPG